MHQARVGEKKIKVDIMAELIFANCSTLEKIAELIFAIQFLVRIYMGKI